MKGTGPFLHGQKMQGEESAGAKCTHLQTRVTADEARTRRVDVHLQDLEGEIRTGVCVWHVYVLETGSLAHPAPGAHFIETWLPRIS